MGNKTMFATVGGGCGCIIIILIISLTLGAVCFDYALYSFFGKDIPWYGDAACGMILSAVVIPLALVCWVIRACDVEAPFIGQKNAPE